jgi:CIC family chloride channel protein
MERQSGAPWCPSILRRPTWTEAEQIQRHQDHLLLLLTLLIGAVVGLVIVAFIVVTERLGSRLYPAEGAAWRRLVMPIAGALLSGLLLARYFPGARGSGIPQTKVALFLHRGYIGLSTVLGKFMCSSISLASGIALGREGPAVHLGAGIASVLGRRLGLGPRRVQALVPVGTAAALAAAFNTPISAVLFTLEEILGDLHASVLGSVVISAATSWAVLHMLLGDEPLFHVPAYQLVHPLELGIYALLGVVGGLVSVAFVRLLLRLRQGFRGLPARTQWLQPAAGGLVVGLIGWFVPDVLGVGYAHVGDALNGKMVLGVMGLLLALKIVATATCYSSGNAGGIFGPSLFIGAMLGGVVGSVAHGLLPDVTGSPGAYALVGMGTAFAGIIRAPMTSVIMIFEITRDYSIIVPLMIANLLSYFISQRLQPAPVYDALLHQEQVHLPPGRARTGGLSVESLMVSPAMTLDAGSRVGDHASLLMASGPGAWPVIDGARFVGMITEARLRAASDAGQTDRRVGDLIHISVEADVSPHLHLDHTSDGVLQRMGRTGLTVLPVVSRADAHTLLGIVALHDMPRASGPVDDESVAEARHLEPTSPRVLLTVVLVGVVGLGALAVFLTQRYYAVRVQTAARLFEEGNGSVRVGRNAEAIEQYRAALSLSHANDHRLALARVLAKTGREHEAELYLREVLRTDPDVGPAHVALARIAAKMGRTDEAAAGYRRARDAAWPDGSEPEKVEADFELAALLARANMPRMAAAELLRLADLSSDPVVLDRIGEGFLSLGLPGDAVDVFRQVLRAAPEDARAWAGLGEAELSRGDYRAARAAFARSARLNPAGPHAPARVALCDGVLELDPTLRGLRSRDRHVRSLRLLAATSSAIQACLGADASDASRSLAERARLVLASKRQPRVWSDAADENASLARELWLSVPDTCRAAVPDDVLARVLARIER